MRLGTAFTPAHHDPDEWARRIRAKGYRAAVCPIDASADEETVTAYASAAARHDVAISEVGAWSNPISPNEVEARQATEKCLRQLDLADRIGARCCVTIAGARGETWDGPYPGNLAPETFDLIVLRVREILDQARPMRTYFTLEAMPWAFPNSPESYLALLKAIDRPRFAVHLDPVNMISNPERYFNNGLFIEECFRKLGPYIKNCHGKDTKLRSQLTVHIDEVIPGRGALDYRTFLRELHKLGDVPLILEHLKTEEEYDEAGAYVRSVASEVGVGL